MRPQSFTVPHGEQNYGLFKLIGKASNMSEIILTTDPDGNLFVTIEKMWSGKWKITPDGKVFEEKTTVDWVATTLR